MQIVAGSIKNMVKQVIGLGRFRNEKKAWFRELTDREIDVLTLIAEGQNNPKIAAELEISRVTVQNHRARIREKLDISSQTDYIRYGLAYNLVQF